MQPADTGHYFKQLHEYLKWQTDRIRELEQRITQLANEVDSLRKQRGITIEKIEYKFDQLKVETLEGTLNVGISSAGLSEKSLEDFSAGGQVIVTNTSKAEAFTRIHAAVTSYLERECPDELKIKIAQHGLTLQEDLRDQMIADLQGQIGPRIQAYLDAMKEPESSVLPPEKEAVITQKVIDDIRAGIEQYCVNQRKGGNASDASSSGE